MRVRVKRFVEPRRIRLLLAPAVLAIAFFASAGSASAFPFWEVQTRWAPQILQPGEVGEFVVTTRNNGIEPSEGMPITLTVQLPPGVTRVPPLPADPDDIEGVSWDCSGVSTVTCTSTAQVSTVRSKPSFAEGAGPYAFIRVAVDPSASGTHTVKTTLEGGSFFFMPGEDVDQVTIAKGHAGFGFVPDSFKAGTYKDGGFFPGEPEAQAGSHPFELKVDFEMNLKHEDRPPPGPGRSPYGVTSPEGHLRTVETTLPRGLIGNPEATPKCDPNDFLESSSYPYTGCPPETQVGIMDLQLSNGPTDHGISELFARNPGMWTKIPVYNLEPPKGVPADFGFHVALADGHIYPILDPAKGYAIKAEVPFVSDLAPIRHAKFTMWGVPGDPVHDYLRYTAANDGTLGAPFNAPIRPLLTMGSDCTSAHAFDQRADSWGVPGVFTPVETTDPPMQVTGCDDPRFRFEPNISMQPTSRAAGGPTGLQVDLEVPQRDQTVANASKLYAAAGDIRGIDTPPMKKAVVTLPEGVTISTSAADGLGNCSAAQLALGTNNPVTCPANSQYGTLTLHTPILPKDEPMSGKIYIAKQNDNPFNNFLSLYLVVEDPERGLLVKIPGKVDLDPVTGQITTTFDDLPPFPVSNMEMNLKGGNRAALVNPATCGTKTIRAEFFSWHDPNTPIVRSSSYEIAHKADGSPCVGSLGERQFKPTMEAGTLNNSAGSYSPFSFRTTRSDDDQEFSALKVGLPKGLLANISGLAKCSDAAIRSAEDAGRTGAEERDNPSCPSSSQIGSTDVGSGVGQVLTYIPGKTYLAGPYKGAPLSMVVITPILAGPYDLGVIAVRSKIEVNPITTQATVTTDPFPQIFKGIPVRIRDVRVNVDRNRTTINPTNCSPMEVTSHVSGTGGDVNSTGDDTGVNLASRFQAADCAALPFKPQLRFRLKGGTNRGDYPAFTATLTAREGEANIAKTAVTLPRSEFLAQEHIRTVCTRVQYAQNACPEGSVYGHASATSPLFDETLSGPVYLRSSSNLLPDLVAKLDGEIDVELSGRIDSKNRGIRNTFDVVPDAPVSTFTLSMQGGKKGLLVNSTNLCKGSHKADVRMTGQNGKTYNSKPVLANSCKKRKKAKSKKAKAHRRQAKR